VPSGMSRNSWGGLHGCVSGGTISVVGKPPIEEDGIHWCVWGSKFRAQSRFVVDDHE
jgi:hypothetical protein